VRENPASVYAIHRQRRVKSRIRVPGNLQSMRQCSSSHNLRQRKVVPTLVGKRAVYDDETTIQAAGSDGTRGSPPGAKRLRQSASIARVAVGSKIFPGIDMGDHIEWRLRVPFGVLEARGILARTEVVNRSRRRLFVTKSVQRG